MFIYISHFYIFLFSFIKIINQDNNFQWAQFIIRMSEYSRLYSINCIIKILYCTYLDIPCICWWGISLLLFLSSLLQLHVLFLMSFYVFNTLMVLPQQWTAFLHMRTFWDSSARWWNINKWAQKLILWMNVVCRIGNFNIFGSVHPPLILCAGQVA